MKRQYKIQRIIIILLIGWLAIFMLIPGLLISIISLLTRDEIGLIKPIITFNNYAQLFDQLYLGVITHSFYIAGMATLLCLLIGYPFAFIIAQQSIKKQRIMLFMIIVPFWTNSLIRIYGLKLLVGTKGLMNTILLSCSIIQQPIKIMYSESAVILGLFYILLPFMVVPLYSNIEKLDNTYLEVAKDLGANKLQTFIRIVLPLTMPGIISGCLLVFLPAMGMFYVADLLGGSKNLLIGNIIKIQFLNARDWPLGSAIGVSLIVLMIFFLLIYYRINRSLYKKNYAQ